MRGERGGEAGFTLLEILVALVVLGFLLAGLAQATRFGIDAWNTQTRLAERADEVARVDRVLRHLITQATPPLSADDKPFEGQPHRMVFTTMLPDQPQAGVRRAQVALGVDDAHRLVLRWQPHANAAAMSPLPAPQQVVLAQGVDRLDLSYQQAGADGGKWTTKWGESTLPALVQLHIVLLPGPQKPWPDLVVVPMLDPDGSF